MQRIISSTALHLRPDGATSHRSLSNRTDKVSRAQRRSAYTLIEILIASILVATLMTAAWGILSMYNSLITDGRSRVAEQQLARSLFDLMRNDLADLSLPMSTGSRAGGTTDNDYGELQLRPDEELPFDVELPGNSGTGFGDSAGSHTPVAVQITGSDPLRMTLRRAVAGEHAAATSDIDRLFELGGGQDPEFDTGDGQQPLVEEFTTVIYQFQAPFTTTGTATDLPPGLYRIQADPLAVAALEQSRTSLQDTMAEQSEALDRIALQTLFAPETEDILLAAEPARQVNSLPQPDMEHIPEVVACRFEYFADSSWHAEWNDDQATTRPAAIRISLAFLATGELEFTGLPTEPIRSVDELPADMADRAQTVDAPGPEDNTDPVGDPLQTLRPRVYEQIMLLSNDAIGPENSPVTLEGGSFQEVLP